MWPLLRDSVHDFFINKEFARTRLRTVIAALGTGAGALVATGATPTWIPEKYAPFVMGAAFVVSSAIGQGEKNPTS